MVNVNVNSRNIYTQMGFLPEFPGTILLNLIEGKTLDSSHIELVTRLIKRESCAIARM
jgi:hypothetical protein